MANFTLLPPLPFPSPFPLFLPPLPSPSPFSLSLPLLSSPPHSPSRFPLSHAVVCTHPVDDRLLFAIPWGEQTYVGTTDTDYDGPPEEVVADASDVDYLLEVSNAYFPRLNLTRGWMAAMRAAMPMLTQARTRARRS